MAYYISIAKWRKYKTQLLRITLYIPSVKVKGNISPNHEILTFLFIWCHCLITKRPTNLEK